MKKEVILSSNYYSAENTNNDSSIAQHSDEVFEPACKYLMTPEVEVNCSGEEGKPESIKAGKWGRISEDFESAAAGSLKLVTLK